jgi:hypothetical protein
VCRTRGLVMVMGDMEEHPASFRSGPTPDGTTYGHSSTCPGVGNRPESEGEVGQRVPSPA